MAVEKISQLPSIGSSAAGDLIPCVQSGVTYSASITQITAAEVTARAAADTTLTTNLSTEVTNRTNADTTLQTNINACLTAAGGVAWSANQPAGTFKITGLGAGSGAGDSVRYEQVMLLTGSTMSGNIAMGTNAITGLLDPVNPQDAATRHYVLGLTVSSLTAPTGSFAMNSHKITGLLNPTEAYDAITLNYLYGQSTWNLNANAGTAVLGASSPLTLTGGTSNKYQVLSTAILSGNKTITPTVGAGFDSDFELFFNPFSLTGGSTVLTVTGGMPYGVGNHLTQKQTFLNISGVYSAFIQPAYIYSGGLNPDMYLRWYSVIYDFAVVGGLVSTISLPIVIPPLSILGSQPIIIETLTPPTSANSTGTATISFGLTGGITNTTAFDTVQNYNLTAFATGGLMRLGVTNAIMPQGPNVISTPTITIGASALTAGKFYIHIPVLINR